VPVIFSQITHKTRDFLEWMQNKLNKSIACKIAGQFADEKKINPTQGFSPLESNFLN